VLVPLVLVPLVLVLVLVPLVLVVLVLVVLVLVVLGGLLNYFLTYLFEIFPNLEFSVVVECSLFVGLIVVFDTKPKFVLIDLVIFVLVLMHHHLVLMHHLVLVVVLYLLVIVNID